MPKKDFSKKVKRSLGKVVDAFKSGEISSQCAIATYLIGQAHFNRHRALPYQGRLEFMQISLVVKSYIKIIAIVNCKLFRVGNRGSQYNKIIFMTAKDIPSATSDISLYGNIHKDVLPDIYSLG